MKAFITLTVVCLIANTWAGQLPLSDEQKAKVKVYTEECIKQENVPEADAVKLHAKDYSDPTDSMKCFATCLFEKIAILKDDQVQEEIVLQKLGAIIGEDKAKEIINNCKDIKGSDRCDTGFKVHQCYETNKAKLLAAN